jgi:ubiquinone/menaquinone biosynthesis C-methylase UbiE
LSFYPALKYHFLTPFYDRIISLLVPEKYIRNKIAKLVNPLPNQHILDFGCGTGTLCFELQKHNSACFITGIDVDPRMIAIAEKKYADLKFCKILPGNIPFSSGIFDTVVSSWVFHHLTFQEKQKAFDEIARVLKPGGVFVLVDWTKPEGIFQQIAFYFLRILDNFITFKENETGKITPMLTNAGFRILDVPASEKTILGTLGYWICSKNE